jgi:DNA-binding MarR family transcriptional regulator
MTTGAEETLLLSSGCVCAHVRMAARAITQIYDEALRPAGLRVTQFGILSVVRQLGPVTLTRLAEATQTDRTTLTRNLGPLSRKRWIRVARGTDRREREVTLTEEGRATLRAALPHWERAQAQMAERLGSERLTRLLGDLGHAVYTAHGS